MRRNKTYNGMVKWEGIKPIMQWSNEKERNRQCNGQMRRNKIDNAMVKWERIEPTMQWSNETLHCRFYSISFDHSIVSFIPSHLTIALSVLFLLIWPFHCRFYSFSFDHSIVGFIPSHLTIALSVLFLLIWLLHCQFFFDLLL
jgi:cbb3-type cytochrome oxidase subunit 3